MNPELIADAMLLAYTVQRDPRSGSVCYIVVPDVAGNPTRHRALLDAVSQPALLGRFQQGDEPLLEIEQVLIQVRLLIAPDETANRFDSEHGGRVHRSEHEIMLFLPNRRIVMEHV